VNQFTFGWTIMQREAQGHPITGATDASLVKEYDGALTSYLQFRLDARPKLATLIAQAPALGMAHVLDGYMGLQAFHLADQSSASEALRRADQSLRNASWREKAHVEALRHWTRGSVEKSLAVWMDILKQHPLDLLAFRQFQNNAFWLGRPRLMESVAAQVRTQWQPGMPGHGTVLACAAFAHEECGDYAAAEAAGRSALEEEPGDMWATHAIAHVMEMQGRRMEGIEFLSGMQTHWENGNHFKHHLWWHLALFHLARREIDTVLDLYDRRFRNVTSPLVVAIPDLYNDILNAASMLFRLEVLGVSAGNRWEELADKAEGRIGDCLSAFTLPHWMMALAWADRLDASTRLLKAVREAAEIARGNAKTTLRDVAIPVCEAVLAHRRGDYTAALAAMRPALGLLQRLGGSHAQRNVLEQLFLDAAAKAGSKDDVRLMRECTANRRRLLSAPDSTSTTGRPIQTIE
jgi:tetratricopeptide (TPR) repeat protein